MARTRAITTSDIAQRAGVSRAAVSVVLNGARSNVRVSQATRQRIEEIAAELGYSPNRTAQALRRRQSGVIGFVPMPGKGLRMPLRSPVQFLLGTLVARAAQHHGFHVVAAATDPAVSTEREGLAQVLLNLRVDGAILHGPKNGTDVQAIVDLGLPVVQLMRPRYEVRTSTITVDPEPGIAAGVAHLMQLGHRRVAFIGTTSTHPNDTARQETFLERLRDHEIVVPEGYVQIRQDYSVEDGCAATRALMSLDAPPTAIFATGDSLALGALHALYALGIRVPDDVTLLSYDDAFVESLYPPLTSVSQPYQQVADQAVAWIAQAVADPAAATADPVHSVFPSRLVVRASSAAPKERR